MKVYLTLIALLLSLMTYSQSTKVVVRAKAKDAKFIGTSIGGAKIIIRDAMTGEILQEGFTQGSTGNTDLIMKQPHDRYAMLSDDETAKFEATVNLQEVKLLTIEALAPYNDAQARVLASTQIWAIPGKDILGDGIILEIPGFIVSVLSPQIHEKVASSTIRLKANVVMMCGCPIDNGGLWDAEKIEVKALVKKEGKLIKAVPLEVIDKVNTFEGEATLPEGGLYEAVIYAYDPRTGNTGVDKVNFMVEEK